MLRTACTTQPRCEVKTARQLLPNPVEQALHAVIAEMLSHKMQGTCRSASLSPMSDHCAMTWLQQDALALLCDMADFSFYRPAIRKAEPGKMVAQTLFAGWSQVSTAGSSLHL